MAKVLGGLSTEPKKRRLSMMNQAKVSLNGPGNVGKTTQILYLPELFEKCSSIQNYDDQMKTLTESNNLSKWWFETSTVEEFVTVIIRAIQKRASVNTSREIVVYDEGAVMFEAVCIATIAMKKKCDLHEAQQIYKSVKKTLGVDIPREDIRILLKHGRTIEESIKISINRQKNPDDIYEKYQALLQRQLALQEAENLYTDVIDVTNMSIVEVQNAIRAICSKNISPLFKPVSIKPMFENINTVIALAGMTKSGKKTLAENICKKLETLGEKCIQLKVSYFIELITTQLASDIHNFSEEEEMNFLVKELDRYARFHHWLTTLTIESLHNLNNCKILKQILGNLLQIVYVDANQEIRIKRSRAKPEELQKNDHLKSSLGIEKIKSETESFIVLNENCTVDQSTDAILDMLKVKRERIATQALAHNLYSGKIALFSHEFVLSAGSVLIHKSNRKVCLIHQLEEKGEWLLPKGRKNINETLEEAAVRETYEETGYKCSLMPVTMETRATPEGEHVKDVSRKMSEISEPFMISLRQIRGSKQNQKVIFWYITQIEERVPRALNTQMSNENFEAQLVSLDEATKLLTHDEDRGLVKMAFEIFEHSHR